MLLTHTIALCTVNEAIYIYNPIHGISRIRFLKARSVRLGPSTFRIMFDLRSDGTTGRQLRPVGGLWSSFQPYKQSRSRSSVGGGFRCV